MCDVPSVSVGLFSSRPRFSEASIMGSATSSQSKSLLAAFVTESSLSRPQLRLGLNVRHQALMHLCWVPMLLCLLICDLLYIQCMSRLACIIIDSKISSPAVALHNPTWHMLAMHEMSSAQRDRQQDLQPRCRSWIVLHGKRLQSIH